MVFDEVKPIDTGIYDEYTIYKGSSENSSIYNYLSVYESYIDNKIKNEDYLAAHIRSKLGLNEYVILTEAVGNKIKAGWEKIVNFLKGLWNKFLNQLDEWFENYKEYFERNKNIILNNEPPNQSVTFDKCKPHVAINRLINTKVPVFEESLVNSYEKELNDNEGSESRAVIAFFNSIMKNVKFSYDETVDTQAQISRYFRGMDGSTDEDYTTQFRDLNMTDIYNYVTKFETMENMVKSDQAAITSSTSAIINFIEQNSKEAEASSKDGGGDGEIDMEQIKKLKQEADKAEDEFKKLQDADKQSETGKGYIAKMKEYNDAINKAKKQKITLGSEYAEKTIPSIPSGGNNTDGQAENNATNESAFYELKVEPSENVHAHTGSVNRDKLNDNEYRQNAAKTVSSKYNTERATKIIEIYERAAKEICAAKLTVAEHLRMEYFKLIKIHVAYYGGKNPDKVGKKRAQTATKYSKNEDKSKNTEGDTSAPSQEQSQGST